MKNKDAFDEQYFKLLYQQVNQTTDGIRALIAQIYIRQGGTGFIRRKHSKKVFKPVSGYGHI